MPFLLQLTSYFYFPYLYTFLREKLLSFRIGIFSLFTSGVSFFKKKKKFQYSIHPSRNLGAYNNDGGSFNFFCSSYLQQVSWFFSTNSNTCNCTAFSCFHNFSFSAFASLALPDQLVFILKIVNCLAFFYSANRHISFFTWDVFLLSHYTQNVSTKSSSEYYF